MTNSTALKKRVLKRIEDLEASVRYKNAYVVKDWKPLGVPLPNVKTLNKPHVGFVKPEKEEKPVKPNMHNKNRPKTMKGKKWSIDEDGFKLCRGECQQKKHINDFYTKPNGYSYAYCRECEKLRHANRRKKSI